MTSAPKTAHIFWICDLDKYTWEKRIILKLGFTSEMEKSGREFGWKGWGRRRKIVREKVILSLSLSPTFMEWCGMKGERARSGGEQEWGQGSWSVGRKGARGGIGRRSGSIYWIDVMREKRKQFSFSLHLTCAEKRPCNRVERVSLSLAIDGRSGPDFALLNLSETSNKSGWRLWDMCWGMCEANGRQQPVEGRDGVRREKKSGEF